MGKGISSKVKIIMSAIALVIFIAIGVVVYTFQSSQTVIEVNLCVGESMEILNEPDTSKMTVGDDSIVSLDEKNIVAVSEGTTEISYQKSIFKKITYKVNVSKAPSSIIIGNGKPIRMGLGEKVLTTTYTDVDEMKSRVKYKVENEDIVTVDTNGRLTGNIIGKTKLIAETYNGISTSVDVIVEKAVEQMALTDDYISISQGTKHRLNHKFIGEGYSNEVTYSSSVTSVAKVSKKGVITAVGEGRCTIIAQAYNGVTARCSVVVTKSDNIVKLFMVDNTRPDTNVRINVVFSDDSKMKDYTVTSSDENVISVDADDKTLLHSHEKGTATLKVELDNGEVYERDITVRAAKYSSSLYVEPIEQYPDYPSGNEVIALGEIMNYVGIRPNFDDVVDNYLPMKSFSKDYSMNDYFLGNVRIEGESGCNPQVLVDTANKYIEENGFKEYYYSFDTSITTLEELYVYVDNYTPVVVWVTDDFSIPQTKDEWEVSGDKNVIYEKEHAVALCGYDRDSNTVTVCDGLKGTPYEVDKDKFLEVFKAVGRRAMVIQPYE